MTRTGELSGTLSGNTESTICGVKPQTYDVNTNFHFRIGPEIGLGPLSGMVGAYVEGVYGLNLSQNNSYAYITYNWGFEWSAKFDIPLTDDDWEGEGSTDTPNKKVRFRF